jgi:aspartyl-tRNA(Asn)/glutamyl-tRNA(Gln) amidotransferase subunit C
MKKELLSLADVKKIASLARLRLSPEAAAAAQRDLAGILKHFSQIQSIDTRDVPTSDDVTGLKNVTRLDEARPEAICSSEDILAAAPSASENHIKVKAVFD